MRRDRGRGPHLDWSDDDADIVVSEQPPVGIYTNPKGAVVIRQPAAEHDEDDGVIWFAPQHALAVAKAILAAARIEPGAVTPEPARGGSKSKSANGAERQRRYRARHQKQEPPPDLLDRDAGDVTDAVTQRDAGDGDAA